MLFHAPSLRSAARGMWNLIFTMCAWLGGWLRVAPEDSLCIIGRSLVQVHRGFGGRIVFDLRADAVPWRSDNPVARTPKIKVRVPR
jgi:hypothetical protein